MSGILNWILVTIIFRLLSLIFNFHTYRLTGPMCYCFRFMMSSLKVRLSTSVLSNLLTAEFKRKNVPFSWTPDVGSLLNIALGICVIFTGSMAITMFDSTVVSSTGLFDTSLNIMKSLY